ncbi:MAG: flavin-containing monooxygenase [Thermoleophilaceae bacterium]
MGAGFGGIATANALRQAGIENFAVLERGDDLGGVWRENTYPGAACDIPSHLYSFSYAQRRDWSRPCPSQSDILDYLHEVAERFGIADRIETDTEVTSATFDEQTARWTVTTAGGERIDAGAVVVAAGQLSRPFTPAIEGSDEFAGTVFHSAEWDHSFDARGKRIAVIGTGASAVQFVPEIAKEAARVDVYQRTPPWMLPRRNNDYAPWAKRLIERAPGLQWIRRKGMLAFLESGISGQTRVPAIRASMRLWSTWFMRRQVREPQLRRRIWPDYPIGCKRVLFSSKYLPALQQENVELVTDPIARISEGGPVTADGREREVDCIVWGTGFKSHEFVAPMAVHGRDGRELSEQWKDGARAHLGVQVSGFPNLFLIYGPNTNLGFGSIVLMIEAQVTYVVDALRTLRRERADAMDIRPEVQDASTARVQEQLRHSVWTTCESWYRQDSDGRIVNNWPGQMAEYVRATRKVDPQEQELVRADD